MKGLTAYVYRAAMLGGCCRANGLGRAEAVTVVGPGVEGVFEPTPDAPPVILEDRGRYGVRAVPAIVCTATGTARPLTAPGWVGPMWGGAFVYSSDGRFPAQYPIPLHDRFERPEDMPHD